jgi:hypothetical protein
MRRGLLLRACLMAGPALVLLLAGPTVPDVGEVGAQVSLAEREARYLAARSAYESGRREWEQAWAQYELAKDRFLVPDRAGADREAQEAFGIYMARAQRLQTLEVRERELREELEAARRDLIQALDAREASLLDRLESDPPPAIEAQLNQQIVDVRRRLRDVEREAQPLAEMMVRTVPNLVVDPRDGPRELREKATFLEDVAGSYDVLIDNLDRAIEGRSRRLRQERGQADLLADLSRFDTDRLPGTGVRPDAPRTDDGRLPGEGGPGGAFVFAELPLTEQVEMLRSHREQAVRFQEDALARAELFRTLAAGGPPR